MWQMSNFLFYEENRDTAIAFHDLICCVIFRAAINAIAKYKFVTSRPNHQIQKHKFFLIRRREETVQDIIEI